MLVWNSIQDIIMLIHQILYPLVSMTTRIVKYDLLPDVKYAYNNFFNSCIHYLKAKDMNDLAQSEYKDFVFTEENEVITDVSLNEVNQQENCLEADKIMLRTIKMPPEPCLDKPSFKKGKKILAPPFAKLDRNNINNIYEDTSQEK